MAFSLLPISISPNGIAESVVSDLIKAMINEATGLASTLVKTVIGQAVAGTTDINSNGNNWFASVAELLFPIEELVVAPLLFAATIGAIIRQDMRRLGRAWGVGLPLSLIGGYAVVQLTGLALKVGDAITSAVQYQVAPNLQSAFVGALTAGSNPLSPAGPLGGLLSLVVIAGGLAIWLELALRSAAIELAAFFMPLALAGLVWPATAHWAKRLVELLGALVLAKPVIVGALCLGTNALTSAQAGPSSFVTGAAMLLLAAFAPMVLLKLVPIVEGSAIAHLQGVSRQPFHAAERTVHRVVGAVNSAAGGAAAARGAASSGDVSGGAAQLLSQVSRPGGDNGDPLGPGGTPPSVRADSQAAGADG